MKLAIRISTRGTLSFSSAWSTSGKLVVAPSSTAESAPTSALAAADGVNSATSRTGNSTMLVRRMSTPGGTRASAATSNSVSAQATYVGHAVVETATTVIAAKPSTFVRGSSRWIGLCGFPATPTASSPALT